MNGDDGFQAGVPVVAEQHALVVVESGVVESGHGSLAGGIRAEDWFPAILIVAARGF